MLACFWSLSQRRGAAGFGKFQRRLELDSCEIDENRAIPVVFSSKTCAESLNFVHATLRLPTTSGRLRGGGSSGSFRVWRGFLFPSSLYAVRVGGVFHVEHIGNKMLDSCFMPFEMRRLQQARGAAHRSRQTGLSPPRIERILAAIPDDRSRPNPAVSLSR